MKLDEELVRTRDATLKYFELPESSLTGGYAPGKWTARQILCHLADAESVLYDRLRRVISEPRQVIWAFDQDAWAAGLDYDTFPMDISRALFAAAREGVIHLAKREYERLGSKEFVHSETGLRTLKDEFDKIALHNAHHLKQIERALGDG
jgi:hypothetical protein